MSRIRNWSNDKLQGQVSYGWSCVAGSAGSYSLLVFDLPACRLWVCSSTSLQDGKHTLLLQHVSFAAKGIGCLQRAAWLALASWPSKQPSTKRDCLNEETNNLVKPLSNCPTHKPSNQPTDCWSTDRPADSTSNKLRNNQHSKPKKNECQWEGQKETRIGLSISVFVWLVDIGSRFVPTVCSSCKHHRWSSQNQSIANIISAGLSELSYQLFLTCPQECGNVVQNRMATQGFPKIVRSLTYLYFYIPATSCALLAYPCVVLVKEALAVTLVNVGCQSTFFLWCIPLQEMWAENWQFCHGRNENTPQNVAWKCHWKSPTMHTPGLRPTLWHIMTETEPKLSNTVIWWALRNFTVRTTGLNARRAVCAPT